MAFCYSEGKPSEPFDCQIPPTIWPENMVMGAYKKHVENRAYLMFMYQKGTYKEKMQAEKELTICYRKLAYWEKHKNFNKARAAEIIAKVKGTWK